MAKRMMAFIAAFETQTHLRSCEWPGCGDAGHHPAPRQETKIISILQYNQQARWFCAQHIRDYNHTWNFFDGMSEAEIARFNHDALTGHRPTWKHPQFNAENVRQRALRFRRGIDGFEKMAAPLPEKERKALRVFALNYPVTLAEIKIRYRELVKRLHPDRHKGNRKTLERLKSINLAYHTLKHSCFFAA